MRWRRQHRRRWRRRAFFFLGPGFEPQPSFAGVIQRTLQLQELDKRVVVGHRAGHVLENEVRELVVPAAACELRWDKENSSSIKLIQDIGHSEHSNGVGPNHVEPWKWPNPVRKVHLQIVEDLGWKVPGLKLVPARTLRCGISVKMYPSSCDLYAK